jgi:hypothetical protein
MRLPPNATERENRKIRRRSNSKPRRFCEKRCKHKQQNEVLPFQWPAIFDLMSDRALKEATANRFIWPVELRFIDGDGVEFQTIRFVTAGKVAHAHCHFAEVLRFKLPVTAVVTDSTGRTAKQETTEADVDAWFAEGLEKGDFELDDDAEN